MEDYIVKSDWEGIDLLNGMANSIDTFIEDVTKKADEFVNSMDAYQALGPHKKGMLELIEEVLLTLKAASGSAATVGEKLRKEAKDIEEWIEDDTFSKGK